MTEAKADYAELHCHSNFSFLDGASHPEELVEEAVRLGLSGLGLTDHNGLYGVVKFAQAAEEVGLSTIFGAELSMGLTKRQNGVADPEGTHLVVLARNPDGYAQLSRVLSHSHLRGKEKGKPIVEFAELADAHRDNWAILTGCRKGAVARALAESPQAAKRELEQLQAAFGRDNVYVELWDHGDPLDGDRNDALSDLASACGALTIVTNNVHYATPARHKLATALAAVRARRSLDDIDGWLPASSGAHLRSAQEQLARFARYPGAVSRSAELGKACAFSLRLLAPRLPKSDVPDGHTDASWLRHLTYQGALRRYGTAENERVPGAYAQIDRELALIEALDFPGYFLIVHGIVEFCRKNDIYCQGRGSAANSAVCYALGITNADAVKLDLLFERFLTPDRDGPPDIDVDIESDRREEVIQYVYQHYGRERAALVCNVVTYRPRSAVRDVAKAFGHGAGQQDAWSKNVDSWGALVKTDHPEIPAPVVDMADELLGFPRHLGIHSGGMVLCEQPVIEVCPVEWATKEDRTVLQWDKDDCAAAGLVKFDLLGLGMLSMLHYAVDMIRDSHGVELDLALLPQEDGVYEMLSRADCIGVFQVESRAQMATLPRLRPRTFYDLVVEVAIIRPGPIQGGSVHPYIRRRNNREEVTYPHPLLEPALRKTLGVPLFQEQMMQMAIDIADFTAAEADRLRQAMSSRRSEARMEKLKDRLFSGMAEKGVTGEVAEDIYKKLLAFSSFGFPESHAVSFANLVYASAWIKYHYPAAFLAALLKAQPMGFWSPQTLSADARRHGVTIYGPGINASGAETTLDGDGCVRVGLNYVRTIEQPTAERIVAGQPYSSMEDVASRCALSKRQIEALATAGAFDCFATSRRSALWSSGAVAQAKPDRLPGILTGVHAPALPMMTNRETSSADLWSMGFSPTSSPMEFARESLQRRGVLAISQLETVGHGKRIHVGGVVTHRQRPGTANGITFLNLEDETGIVNIMCLRGAWKRFRHVALNSQALVIRGTLEHYDNVINVVAEKIEPLKLPDAANLKSRDFH